SVSYNKLGDVAVSAGKLDDARAWFDKALAVAKALAAADPSNTGWQDNLSLSYKLLGHVAMSAGKRDDARAWFDKDLAVRKALAPADPNNARWQRDLCIALAEGVLIARGSNEELRYLDEARIIYDRLQREGSFRGDEQFAQIGTDLDQLARALT